MKSRKVTPDELLARLALPWIEIAPSRKKLPKRSLPPHAGEPSPNVVVLARPGDQTSLDICSQFRQQHWKPKFNLAHVPTDFAWQIVTPGGERLLLFTWNNWQRNSRQMFEEFCRATQREFGTITPDGMIVLGSRQIPLRDCRLVHEVALQVRVPAVVKQMSAESILKTAEGLLKGRVSRCVDLDYRQFADDAEAYDDGVQQATEAVFLDNMASYEMILTAKYGPPTAAGEYEHERIPVNGQVRHVMWKVGRQRLYLAVSHEDREMPWVTLLGVTT
jgi:hypothetical protein